MTSLTVLSDGRLASGAIDDMVRIWNLGSGACDRVLLGHTHVREGDRYMYCGLVYDDHRQNMLAIPCKCVTLTLLDIVACDLPCSAA